MRSFVELRRGKKHERLPIRLHNGSGIGGLYSVGEARQLVEDIEAAIAELDNAGIVRVKPIGYTKVYTYEFDGELEVGDLVEVPFGPTDSSQIARVEGFGRFGYDGPLKKVVAKLERTLL